MGIKNRKGKSIFRSHDILNPDSKCLIANENQMDFPTWHQRHAAATTTHAVETVQVH